MPTARSLRRARLRDAYRAELEASGQALPMPILPGRCAPRTPWLPAERRPQFRRLSHENGIDEAKRIILAELAEERRVAAEVKAAERARPKTFEEQLALVAAGRGLVATFTPRRADPAMTLGGVATGAL